MALFGRNRSEYQSGFSDEDDTDQEVISEEGKRLMDQLDATKIGLAKLRGDIQLGIRTRNGAIERFNAQCIRNQEKEVDMAETSVQYCAACGTPCGGSYCLECLRVGR